MKKILLHSCCAPCSVASIIQLKEQNYTPHLYFFNPNIHLQHEFNLRLGTMEEFAKKNSLPLIIADYKEFFQDLADKNNVLATKKIYSQAANHSLPFQLEQKNNEMWRSCVLKTLKKWTKHQKEFREFSFLDSYKYEENESKQQEEMSAFKDISFEKGNNYLKIDVSLWLDSLSSYKEGERCKTCYEQRLYQSAKYAATHGFNQFSSTLLYSCYQNHEDICFAAKTAEEKVNQELSKGIYKGEYIEFYYQDFRPVWDKGIEMAKEQNMYRQKWCGCILSRMESLERMAMREFNKQLAKKK